MGTLRVKYYKDAKITKNLLGFIIKFLIKSACSFLKAGCRHERFVGYFSERFRKAKANFQNSPAQDDCLSIYIIYICIYIKMYVCIYMYIYVYYTPYIFSFW